MKKLISLILLLCLLLTTVACGTESADSTATSAAPLKSNTIEEPVSPEESTPGIDVTKEPDVLSTIGVSTTNEPETNKPEPPQNDPNLLEAAKKIMEHFGGVPDVWSFMPEGLSPEHFQYDTFSGLNGYASDIAVDTLPTCYIGKQLNVVYTVADYTASALSYVRVFYQAMNVVTTAYQAFINENPDNYASFSGSEGDLIYTILILEDSYSANCAYKGVSFTISAEMDARSVACVIQLAENTVLKYDCSDDNLRIAVSAANMFTAQLEFVRENDVVTGYVFHSEGYEDTVLTTTACISFDENYTYITGQKGDFANPLAKENRVCEVYDSKTGVYIGSEVKEKVALVDYDTVWIPLWNFSGIQSLRKLDAVNEDNKMNFDTVYINGKEMPFVPEFNSKLGIKTSRQYDIEFKTVYIYLLDGVSGAYKKQAIEVPMIFVQRDNLGDFVSKLNQNNDVTVINLQSQPDATAVEKGFVTYLPLYDQIKELVTLDIVKEYLGIKTGQ